MPPVGLSVGEAIGLWLSFRLGREGAPGPAGESMSTALNKILATLPDERRSRYESVLNRIAIGVAPGAALVSESASIRSEVYRECETAVIESRRLRFDYVDRTGTPGQRDAEPHGMLVQAPLWYLLSYDLLRGAPRMFRMDRIAEARADPVLRFEPVDPHTLFKEIKNNQLELQN